MADLQIVISALNNASEDIGDVKGDIEELGPAGDTASGGLDAAGLSMEGLIGVAIAVAGAIGAVVGAMEEVYSLAERGAAIDTTADQFKNLAESMGIQAVPALNAMRTASEGLITDMELVSGGTRALSLGVVDSADGLARLATVSADLNLPLNKVVDMVNNVSPAGFERLGISMDGFNEDVAGLVSSGWTESNAKTEVGLQRLEEQVKRVGSATDTQSAAFIRNEVALQNSKDLAAQMTAMNAGPMIDAYHGVTEATVANQRATLDGARALTELKAAKDAEIITTDQYQTAVKNLGIHSGKLQGNAEGLTAATELLDAAYAETGTTFDSVTGKVVEATGAVETLNNTPLEDKDATVTYDIDDDEVKNYDPPTKYATVVYSAGGGGENVNETRDVGGAVYGGNPYTWQEYGYKGELFVPSSDGFVMSRADAERALSKALTGGGAAMDPDAIGKAVAKALSGVTKDNQKGGNVYNLTMPTSSNPADVRTAFELMEAWA